MAADLFRGPGNCLTPAQLEQALTADLQGEAATHLNACPRCQADAKLLASFLATEEPDIDEMAALQAVLKRLPSLPPARESIWQRWFGSVTTARAAIGFACLMLIVVGITYQRRGVGQVDLGSLESDSALRGSSLQALEPRGGNVSMPAKFRWSGHASASRYRVQVAFVDKTALWAAESTATETAIPEQVGAALRAERPLVWKISAIGADGQILEETGWIEFRLAPSNR